MNGIDQAIFITNVFAQEHPQLHVNLWTEFEAAVPLSQRSGHYGADNVAYVKFLKQKEHPTFVEFFTNSVESRGGL